MKRLITITILLGIIALISSCTKKCWIYYDLEIPVTIETKADTIQIGDTISININFDENVYDLNSQKNILIKNFDFDQSMRIVKLTDSTKEFKLQEEVLESDFDFVNKVGLIEPLSSISRVNLLYHDNRYELQAFLIAKQEGIYSITIGFTSLLSGGKRYEVDFQEGKCKEELVEQTIKINQQSDGTFDTNWEILKDNTNNEPFGNLNRTTYTFVVE